MRNFIYLLITLAIVVVSFSGCSGRTKSINHPVHRTENIYHYADGKPKNVYINSFGLSNYKYIKAYVTEDIVSAQYYNVKSYYNRSSRKEPDLMDAINVVNPFSLLIDPAGYVDDLHGMAGKTKEKSKIDYKEHFTGKTKTVKKDFNGYVDVTFSGTYKHENKFRDVLAYDKGKSSLRVNIKNGRLNMNITSLISKLPVVPTSGTLRINVRNNGGYSQQSSIQVSQNWMNNILNGYRHNSSGWLWKAYELYDQSFETPKDRSKQELISKLIELQKRKDFYNSIPYFIVIEKLFTFKELPNSFDYMFAKSEWKSKKGDATAIANRLNSYLTRVTEKDIFYTDAKKLLAEVRK